MKNVCWVSDKLMMERNIIALLFRTNELRFIGRQQRQMGCFSFNTWSRY